MPIEECPHCIQKVVIHEDGKCPSCGKSKYILPNKSREKIIYDYDKEDALEKIKFYNNRIRRLIIGGVFAILIIVGVIILLMIYSMLVVYWYGGLLIGLSMISKGLIYKRDKKELKLEFEKKYNEKL